MNLQHQHKTSHFQLLASQLGDLRRGRSLLSFSLSFFFNSFLIYSLSLSFSLRLSPSLPCLCLASTSTSSAILLSFLRLLILLDLRRLFFTSPLILPSFTFLLKNHVIVTTRVTRNYALFLYSPSSLLAPPFFRLPSVTLPSPFIHPSSTRHLSPTEARSSSRVTFDPTCALVRERGRGALGIDRNRGCT